MQYPDDIGETPWATIKVVGPGETVTCTLADDPLEGSGHVYPDPEPVPAGWDWQDILRSWGAKFEGK